MLTSAELFQALLTLHLIGLALGLGGVAVTDFSFARTLRMRDSVTPETVTWMRSFSVLIWVGLGILALSGFGLFLFHPYEYLHSPGFQAKMIFVAVLTINGLFLNYYTTARLTTFNFSEHYQHRNSAWKARKLSFVFGAISTTSWYAALLAAMFKELIGLSLAECIAIYVIVLIVAIASALLLEQLIMRYRLKLAKRPIPNTIDTLTSQVTVVSEPLLQAPAPQPPVATTPVTQPAPTTPASPTQNSPQVPQV